MCDSDETVSLLIDILRNAFLFTGNVDHKESKKNKKTHINSSWKIHVHYIESFFVPLYATMRFTLNNAIREIPRSFGLIRNASAMRLTFKLNKIDFCINCNKLKFTCQMHYSDLKLKKTSCDITTTDEPNKLNQAKRIIRFETNKNAFN